MRITEKKQLAQLVGGMASVSLTGLGLVLGGPLETILAGLGINLGSNVIQEEVVNRLKAWISGDKGMLNHNIQRGLAWAWSEALKEIQGAYFQTEAARRLDSTQKDAIERLFYTLCEHPKQYLVVVSCT